MGTRYSANLGCLFPLESRPTSTAFQIAKNLTPKRMTEYGANHSAYQDLLKAVPQFEEPDMSKELPSQLSKTVDVLDLTSWQRDKLLSLNLKTIENVLRADESTLQQAYYVGEKRSRRMRNAAMAAVYEYLSG